MADLEQLKEKIALDHLDQLKNLNRPPRKIKPGFDADDYYNTLVKYTQDNISAINIGLSTGVWSQGNKNPNWKRTFLPFMESCATYLRDEDVLAAAVEVYKDATAGDAIDEGKKAKALELYANSTKRIAELASMWGMGFTMITDLLDDPNDPYIGPYVGAFFPTGSYWKPFIGVAFKGTLVWSPNQDWIDWNYQPTQVPPPRLFGAEMSTGVYNSLFDVYNVVAPNQIPYVLVSQAVTALTAFFQRQTKALCPTHVTGHSLGASYSCLAYAQLLIDYNNPSNQLVRIGDLYNFGCPRVGLRHWADQFWVASNQNPGACFRVVNSSYWLGDDFVTQVPPTPQIDTYNGPWFNHIDVGWRIAQDARPIQIPTERGTQPQPPSAAAAAAIANHETSEYYKSLLNAMSYGAEDSTDPEATNGDAVKDDKQVAEAKAGE